MQVRLAEVKDIDSISILFDQYRVFYKKEADMEAAVSFISDRIRNEDSVIYLAEENGEIVGFTQLYPLFSSTRMQKLWLLNDLFVAPLSRGKGFSIALIEKSKELCRNTKACAILLETAKTNIIGNQLYPKTGFILESETNYYAWENDTTAA